MAENKQKHRHEIGNKSIDAEIKNMKLNHYDNILSKILAFPS